MVIVLLCFLSVMSFLCVRLYKRYAIKNNILDNPNFRSSHTIPIPRGAGITFAILWSVFLIVLFFIGLIPKNHLVFFVPPAILISVVGFGDDRYQLAAKYRFVVQFIAALYVLIHLGGFSFLNLSEIKIYLGWFGYILAMLILLWSTNLYNFMDGIDGSAATEALFVLGVGGYFIWSAGGHDLAIIIWAMGVIVLSFLFWNKPPAKIFMGDAGSTLLGFLIACFAIFGEKKYHVSLFLWIILYGAFWFDATLTLVRRVLKGEKWYQAHKLHAFQRLQHCGWSHGKILVGLIISNIILALVAILTFYLPQYLLFAVLFTVSMLSIVYLAIEKSQPMFIKKD